MALARALIAEPKILLLDEPFSALDAMTREDLQDHLLELWALKRPTIVLVTHDIEEAAVLADRIAILAPHPGRLKTVVTNAQPRPRRRDDDAVLRMKRSLRTLLEPTRPTRANSFRDRRGRDAAPHGSIA